MRGEENSRNFLIIDVLKFGLRGKFLLDDLELAEGKLKERKSGKGSDASGQELQRRNYRAVYRV